MSLPAVLSPGEIAGVETRNRIIRSSTSETMADDRGIITQQYLDLHTRLARNGVGLIFTGHCSVHPRGNYIRGMTALDRDEVIGPMRKLTDASTPREAGFLPSSTTQGARVGTSRSHRWPLRWLRIRSSIACPWRQRAPTRFGKPLNHSEAQRGG